ncbi:MAG: hypothetical protein JSS27_11280 [Planctomycetes bacterium]|nr:hypothetical protein [Planctomycetota bacterium]
MDTFTQRNLQDCLETTSWPCVTIYLPTSPSGAAGQQGPIRLKNLLNRAGQKLLAEGIDEEAAARLLKPGRALVDDTKFWHDQSQGLMVILTTAGMKRWQLPMSVVETVAVGHRVCIKPVLPLLTDNHAYFVLAVSQNGVRLYRGDRWQLERLAVDTLPVGLTQALNYQPPQGMVQVLGASGGGRGDQGTMYHGQGGEVDRHKDELRTWFRMINGALHDYLGSERAPLLFAGVQYLFPIYQDVNTYPQLFGLPVHGSPEHWSDAELHRRVVEMLAPVWRQAAKNGRERIEEHLGTARVSASIENILSAAFAGAVDTVFVDRDDALWGKFNSGTGSVELTDETTPGAEDLFDLAAYQTLKHRGSAFAVAGDTIPAGIGVAAFYRYELPAAAPSKCP